MFKVEVRVHFFAKLLKSIHSSKKIEKIAHNPKC